MRKDGTPVLEVEDHGNGYMVIGTNQIHIARAELWEYVDEPAFTALVFAAVTNYGGRSAVWFSAGPAENWDGAKDHTGKPLRRS